VNEFDIIKQYFQQPNLSFPHPNIAQSIGDDCAILTLAPQQQLVMSMDTLVEGVHFLSNADAYDIGTRSLCVTLSDLAAMGATPIGFTLGITLPNASEPWLQEFSDGLANIATKYQCPLIGGDTTRGPGLVITIQVHGQVAKGKALLRSGAQVGDKLYVSGNLGDAAGALPMVLKDPKMQHPLMERYYRPLPQIAYGQQLLGVATSALDISDGLMQDVRHLCQASQVSMEIDVQALPLSEALVNTYGQEQALSYALTGGDDYQLAYTAAHCDKGICIGRVVPSNGTHEVRVNGLTGTTITQQGYQHF